ncbi:hypothetical protein TNCV_1056031 [Trichonephila clavipes]|nr:hypothetical protein TNCV_1056031 [Trichonephila clavipes]
MHFVFVEKMAFNNAVLEASYHGYCGSCASAVTFKVDAVQHALSNTRTNGNMQLINAHGSSDVLNHGVTGSGSRNSAAKGISSCSRLNLNSNNYNCQMLFLVFVSEKLRIPDDMSTGYM